MARSRKSSIELTAYDDLFQTDESRAEAALSKIRDIPISEIDEFPDHPFKVLMDEDMEQLVDSIKRNGVMTPATVRLKEDGRYELISGHRRKKACELAGLDTLKCEVKEFSRDEAIIVMVESNLQRTTILPSEKAFAYKMRLEAMNRQGQRLDLTSTPMVSKSRSNEELADKVGESREQIRRYEEVADFWKVLLDDLNAFQEYIQLTRKDKPISAMRENNLLLKPVTQMALAHVARMAKNKGIEWRDIVEKLNKISWSFDNELWFNLLVISSANKKMITGKEAVRGVGMVISYLVMGDKMTKAELADVKTVYGNAKNNPDEPLPARV